MTDEQIVNLYWERSESAIEETQKAYGRYFHYIAYGILRDDEDAKEIVNDTYLKAWNCIPPQRPNPLKTFLGRITRQLALRDALNAFLWTLPAQMRKIFIRRYWYMCSITEIAVDFSMGESRVKMQLLRTREKLREHLRKEGFGV